MRILYGVQGHYKDVTELAKKHFKYECLCLNNGVKYLRIPSQPIKRDNVFGDPIVGTVKHIFLNGERKNPGVLYINVDLHEKMSPSSNIRNKLNLSDNYNTPLPYENAKQRLTLIHSSLALNYVSFDYLHNLQVHCLMYIKPKSKVLLIDEDMTALSVPLIIASILIDDSTFTVFCNNDDKIKENRDLNEFSFKIEKVNDLLIQSIIDSREFDIIVICNPHKKYITEDKGYKLTTSINTEQMWTL